MESGTAAQRVKAPAADEMSRTRRPVDLHTQIARRAYQLYEDRGRKSGRDLEDWLQAEQEILSAQMDADLG